jgi:hypothetical protein
MKKVVCVPVGTPRVAEERIGGLRIVYDNTISIDPEQELERLLDELNTIFVKHSLSYQNLHFDREYNCYCPSNCNCAPSYVLYGSRIEDDTEYNFRVSQEANEKIRKNEIERETYERLKEKFERK